MRADGRGQNRKGGWQGKATQRAEQKMVQARRYGSVVGREHHRVECRGVAVKQKAGHCVEC
jgi:hypothetical protein